jgi:cytochrome oxidase Cu insertion factor (SCO1/SenC/PrrC family)
MRILASALVLAACSGKPAAPEAPEAVTTAATEPAADAPAAQAALHGERLSPPTDIPAFAALSHDGTPRSREDLLGHPTVMWFFPAAGTPG